jgi:hypothetical protein
MRTLSAVVLGVAALLSLPLVVGCDQQSKVEDRKTVETPNGETTRTDTTKIERSGDHRTDR